MKSIFETRMEEWTQDAIERKEKGGWHVSDEGKLKVSNWQVESGKIKWDEKGWKGTERNEGMERVHVCYIAEG